MTTVVVRAVEAGEWRRLRALRLRALADAPDAFLESHDDAAAAPDELWQRRAAGEPGVVNVVAVDVDVDDGEWLGMAAGFTVDGIVQVVGVWTEPAARGRGVATALTTAVVDWARATGAAACRLETAAGNERARRVYRRLGFVEVDEPPSGSACDVVMRLSFDRGDRLHP